VPGFSSHLERSLHRALTLANERHHEYATLEHLLLALTEDQDALAVLNACNVEVDALRRERRTASNDTSDIDSEFLLDESPHADAVVATAQTDSRVRAALAELSEDQRRVVELSFYQEMAHAEIADELGIPLGTVKSRLRLAMNKLRGILDDLS